MHDTNSVYKNKLHTSICVVDVHLFTQGKCKFDVLKIKIHAVSFSSTVKLSMSAEEVVHSISQLIWDLHSVN